MISSNELRIGNWVYVRGDQEKQVTSLSSSPRSPIICTTINGCNWSESHFSETAVNPIHLTEEWLLRFGFQLATDSYKGYLSPKFRNNQKIRVRVSNSGNLYYSSNNSTSPLWIDSAHQLMNLYFALTWEELCLKP